ncbi:17.5 kDa class I heat shock protein-like [Prosopis cineraria]|uniref:17.5 kDa class I heat shock protein-like n=1 Tax=Prosopis cineraria TaxID=364024 RepID=UPI00240EC34B|nr:17.5 kDa class I heat shock protein-like [Prosopis cineraria]
MDRLLGDIAFPPSLGPYPVVLAMILIWALGSGRARQLALPGFADEDVLVELQGDQMLQVRLESGNFMSRFRVPEDADLQHLKASVNHGVLLVTVPKRQSALPNVRVLEIEGGD